MESCKFGVIFALVMSMYLFVSLHQAFVGLNKMVMNLVGFYTIGIFGSADTKLSILMCEFVF